MDFRKPQKNIGRSRKKYAATKLLWMLHWTEEGAVDYITWLSPLRVRVKSGQFARAMQTTSERFRICLHWLEDIGQITNLSHDHGWAEFDAPPPPVKKGNF